MPSKTKSKKTGAKAKKAATPRLRSTEGMEITLFEEHANIGGYLLFRYDIRHALLSTKGDEVVHTFVEGNASKCSRNVVKNLDGSVSVGCQTFNPRTVKALRTWVNK